MREKINETENKEAIKRIKPYLFFPEKTKNRQTFGKTEQGTKVEAQIILGLKRET